MQFIALKLISFYQIFLSFDRGVLAVLAPGGACKYEVSCSEFTKRQIMEYGVLRGSFNGLRRIISCR
jgi:putative component of membrane protein insertase Oxa1/YidC/SpoIIIJ protein YidD